MSIVFDAEMVRLDDPAITAEIEASILPPRTMSKKETIDKWTAEEKPALVKTALEKTVFDATTGKIICLAWAIDDEEIQYVCSGDERQNLSAFYAAIDLPKSHAFIGHNIIAFDLKYLWKRSVILGIRPPPNIAKAFKAKPWDAIVFDTLLLWDSDRDKKISLDRLCKALGVPTSKGDMDGSKVYETYLAGDLDKIATYCREDVKATRECYKRMTFA